MQQSQFNKTTFSDKILSYLNGKITADELYSWSAGFLTEKIEDEFLNIVWETIHQIDEINPDYKTTDEELLYLYQCLIGEKVFSDNGLEAERKEGLKKRFGKNN